MIVQAPTSQAEAGDVALPTLPIPIPFPSPSLVFLNILSCFLATAVFGVALTQIFSWVPLILAILSPTIGFLATVPFHLFLYAFVRRHADGARKSVSPGDTSSLPMWCFVYIFLLVALWLIIFVLEILCCVGDASFGAVITTILAGLECIVIALLAMKCVLDSWNVENMTVPLGRSSEAAVTSEDATLNSGLLVYPRPVPKYLYLASWVLATLAFLSSISPWFTLIADIPIYVFTVIAHVPMFVNSGSSKRSSTQFRLGGAGVSFLLVILWCIFVLVNILGNLLAFQQVLSGIFGVMECIVVGHIAVQRIMESLSPPHSQIRLEED